MPPLRQNPTPKDENQQASPQGVVNALYNLVRVLSTMATSLAKITPPAIPANPTFQSVLLNQGAAGETALSHYGEGVWTPTLLLGGAAVGMTGTFAGTWTRIGREVICRFRIVLTAKGTSTGAATIGGLPFIVNADPTNNGAGGACHIYSGMATLTSFPHVAVTPGAQTAALVESGAAADAALTDANFTNTSALNGEFRYFI